MPGLFFRPPRREFILIAILAVGFAASFSIGNDFVLYGAAVLAAVPPVFAALRDLPKKKITIDVFNTFALGVAFAMTSARSAGFICLMLASARLLDYFTTDRAARSMRSLLALKPATAEVEKDGQIITVSADRIKEGDVLVVPEGGRIAADGVVVFGSTEVDESPLTGESLPVAKRVGDSVFSGTLVVSGALKIRAVHVGKNSTVSRLVELAVAAAANKSAPEKMADKFAGMFLPVVVVLGAIVFFFTGNVEMTAALFLVACADDMSVAVPLAITAALGQAARRGLIVKGGERLAKIAAARILVLDKTGTLTYGNLEVDECEMAAALNKKEFLKLAAVAEKFSEHPAGRAVLRFAGASDAVPDPEKYESFPGAGVVAVLGGKEIVVGTHAFLLERKTKGLPPSEEKFSVWAAVSGAYAGRFSLADSPRPEAKNALAKMSKLGFSKIVMFTGDRPDASARVAAALGIDYLSMMKPEDKVAEIKKMIPLGPVVMVGDGVNDAAALALADVGIAMGSGTAAAAEAADAVILVDDLGRLPELVELARRTIGVVRSDIWLWAFSNLFGFALVLTGFVGPALAAFYNFVTDFFPIGNSLRLFRSGGKK